MPEIVTIETTGLGDRTYLAHDGEVAIVVDPQRDIDRVEDLARALGVRVALVVETHIHNDYVTGGLALARASGATYVVAAADEVDFEREGAGDGDTFEVGNMALTALHTPGHTPHHLSFVLAGADRSPVAVFTGGSMLFGAVGRTDLVGGEHTEALTHAQYRSVRRLASRLGDAVTVHPTHGFGSFCAATETTGDASTVGDQRRSNVALTTDDEDAFVEELIAGLSAFPAYYVHMGPVNRRGPEAPDLSPPAAVDPDELRRRIDAGEWVVDLRRRVAFARSHVEGTISVELGDPFATYLGWTRPWGAPLTLVAERPEEVAEARRHLVRIGIDELAGAAAGDNSVLARGRVASYPVADFAALAAAMAAGPTTVLDVRRPDEWAAGHLRGALHIPLWEVEGRMAEVVAAAGPVWVHCAGGMRSSIAASLVARAGLDVVYVDDDWARAAELGLPMAG